MINFTLVSPHGTVYTNATPAGWGDWGCAYMVPVEGSAPRRIQIPDYEETLWTVTPQS
jgi:hypothetical protein